MGQSDYEKYNDDKIISIDFKINKTCFFPGEMMTGTIELFPRIESIFQIFEDPQLNLILYQEAHYCYVVSSGKSNRTVRKIDKCNLIDIKMDFKNYIKEDYSSGFSIPFSVKIPDNAYPSILTDFRAFVVHYLRIELPQVEGKKAKQIIIKNFFPNNAEKNLLIKNVQMSQVFDKKKFLSDKGSFSLSASLPRNYYYYHEKIPIEINIDCSKLKDLTITFIDLSLSTFTRKNYPVGRTPDRSVLDIIYTKKIELEKGKVDYKINEVVGFPDNCKKFPPSLYDEFDKSGPFELNDPLERELFQSSYGGLVSVDYNIRIGVGLDSSLTFDEAFYIPIYFTIKTENN